MEILFLFLKAVKAAKRKRSLINLNADSCPKNLRLQGDHPEGHRRVGRAKERKGEKACSRVRCVTMVAELEEVIIKRPDGKKTKEPALKQINCNEIAY